MTIAALVIYLLFVCWQTAADAHRIPAAKQSWQWRYRVWMPQHWINLAQCEEGLNWQAKAYVAGVHYEGAYAFAESTWRGYRYLSYPRHAYDATPWQQWRVARRIAAKLTIGVPWGCWRGPQHAWVRAGKPEHGQRT